MITVQEIANIAAQYVTHIADVMIAACVQWAVDHNEYIDIPERKQKSEQKRPVSHVDTEPSDPWANVDWDYEMRHNREVRMGHA